MCKGDKHMHAPLVLVRLALDPQKMDRDELACQLKMS